MFILLWGGDILHSYGLAALVVFWFRRLAPRWLISIGLVMAVMQLVGAGYFNYYHGMQQRAEVAALRTQARRRPCAERSRQGDPGQGRRERGQAAKALAEHKAEIAREDADRSSTTARWVAEQIRMSAERLFGVGELFAIWESASVMLIGAALFKLGILQGERSRRF